MPPHDNCAECPLFLSGEYVAPTGDRNSRYLVIGEAPGAEEAASGKNFVGASGRVLRTAMRSVDIDDIDVQFTNTVRCRPPRNRPPEPLEIEACAPLLNDVLRQSQALAVLAAGRVALNRMVGTAEVREITAPTPGGGTKACWDQYVYEWGDEISGEAIVGKKRGRYGSIIEKGQNKGLPKIETVDIVLDVPRPSSAFGVVASLHPAAVMRGWTDLPLLGSALLRLKELADGKQVLQWPEYETDPRKFEAEINEDIGAGSVIKWIAFDIENPYPYRVITDISFATSSGLVGSFQWRHPFTKRLAQTLLGPGNSWELVAHNSPHDVGKLTEDGVTIDESRVRCTMMASYLDEPDLRKALGHVAPRFLLMKPWKHKSEGDMRLYNAIDSQVTALIWLDLKAELTEKEMMPLYLDAVMPSTRVLRLMHERGIAVDTEKQGLWLAELEKEAAQLEASWGQETSAFTDIPVNPRSPLQLRRFLYEDLALPVLARTEKTKEPSTNVTTIERLVARFPIEAGALKVLLDLRAVQKLIGTYAKQLSIADDGCVHPRYLPATKDQGDFGAASGRLAARDPNIQNQPHVARYMYVPHVRGRVIWTRDYSQIEARIVAQRYSEQWLIDGFATEGFDQHQAMAERLAQALRGLGLSYAELCEARGMDERSFGKKIVHGTNYGMGVNLLAEHLGTSRKAAGQILAALDKAAPALSLGRMKDAEFAADKGYIVNEFKRRRHFPGFIEPKAKQKHVRNAAVNFPPQADVADIMTYIIVVLEDQLTDIFSDKAMLLAQVHDEFVGECEVGQVHDVDSFTKSIMERTFDEIAPGWSCPTTFTVGPNWAACKDIEKAGKAAGRTALEQWKEIGCPAW